MKHIKCDECEEEAEFFHSKCCGKHFDGVIKENRLFIVCEECGKLCGELKE